MLEGFVRRNELKQLIKQVMAVNFIEQLNDLSIPSLSYDHDLFGIVQIQVERAKHMGETEGLVFHDVVVRTQNFLGSLQVIFLSPQMIKA